ncbi:MAG TPA: hypothetical protein VIW03_02265 [Anaeromyxobacter sp.]
MRRAAAILLLAAGTARAQTMLDQEERLIELHSLLVAIPAVQAPGALRPGEASLGLEIVGIPAIDGTTGGRRQITASDRTRVFPRPRLALGLPLAGDLRAFAGVAYIPPIEIRGVSSHLAAAEAGAAWVRGPLAAGLRLSAVYATSRSPVTDPGTRDTLRTIVAGADASLGYRLDLAPGSVTPYAGLGVHRVDGRFRVTSDGQVLTSRTTDLGLAAGARLLARRRVEAVLELVAYPGRLVHPNVRVAWTPELRAR